MDGTGHVSAVISTNTLLAEGDQARVKAMVDEPKISTNTLLAEGDKRVHPRAKRTW